MLIFAGVRLLKCSHSLIYNYSPFNGKHEKDYQIIIFSSSSLSHFIQAFLLYILYIFAFLA